MNTIEIRLAKKEDAQFIALLGRITFTETFGHFFRDQKDLIDYYNLTFSVEKIGDHDFQIGKENFEFIAMKKEL